MALKFVAKGWFVFVISILLLTDLAILLNIPYIRQILGFLFLTFLPGLLIIQTLKLDKIGFTGKFVLSVGLSISFLMFFGLLINNLSLSLGYETPLATIPLLISFNIAFVVLVAVGYKVNKEPFFSLSNLNLSTSEKAFLIVPILFPALSIFGMYVMNTADNNIILMFMLFLIPIYVVFACFFNHKFPKRIYPIVIFLIGISLLLLMALRSNHIIGRDAHSEYYLFRATLDNLHWHVFRGNLGACLSISLLPTIYQSILNIAPEFLFRILYSLIYSSAPLIVYVLSKKYVGESYAFLASMVFMADYNFLWAEYNARTNTAILFFALAMMTLFNDKIDSLKKRILFIVFMASCIVSHYSTTYIFFFILLGMFIGIEILSKKYTFKKNISLTVVILFFALIFFWYSQATGSAFYHGVSFVQDTFMELNNFFVLESRGGSLQMMMGEDIMQKGIPNRIEFLFTWLMFVLIGIGVVKLIRRYKEMSFPELNFKKPDFLKEKFDVGYSVIALVSSGLMVAMVVVPYVAVGYNLDRLYGLTITVLSVFLVIGGITLSKHFFFFTKHFLSKERTCAKKETLFAKQKAFTEKRYRSSFGKAFLSKKRFVLKEKQKSLIKNKSEVRAYFIILLVLIPYFLCVTGVMYNMFGVPHAITLNSKGDMYNIMYIHDQDSYAGKWFGKDHVKQGRFVAYVADGGGKRVLRSQGIFRRIQINAVSFSEHKRIDGYIYLRYYNVVDGLLLREDDMTEYNMSEYADMFIGKNRIYDNGGSEVWR